MELFIMFCVLNVLNVIIQTVKSLATVKCGKVVASVVNAIAYGLYTIVLVYTMCDLPLFTKAIVVAIANLIGVYVVKYFEEKARKDKLWLVKVTIPKAEKDIAIELLARKNIPFSYVDIQKYVVFDCYCETQNDTKEVLEMAKVVGGKCFATENKL